ncbi:calycin-like domain-containing protein [Phocaeicola sartorii]|uniref:calycin-like domain-containing protein n=1 Tax=Phocaeicola sartorii TaxID=671267 RepID=UPI001F57932E|nr:calycin-like domain-containing protein [Phocaeicola sartorii]
MKKNLFYYLFAVICSVTLFASCSDDDDDDVKGLTIDNVVGTFTGDLKVLQQPIPNTSITVIKVDANTVKVELKDFKFGELVIGDITADCKATLDKEGDDFDLNGQTTLTVAALGNIELPITIEGEVDAKELDIDINIINVPVLNTLKVEFEGTK